MEKETAAFLAPEVHFGSERREGGSASFGTEVQDTDWEKEPSVDVALAIPNPHA